ncbi:MAG: hypothetical protein HQK76_01880 [Desulfobacterales bacterium]|nr:hypothetical protein [Desulfobacterales bacterium]
MAKKILFVVLILSVCVLCFSCNLVEKQSRQKDVLRQSLKGIEQSLTYLKNDKKQLEKIVADLESQIRVLEVTHENLSKELYTEEGFLDQYELLSWQLNIVLLMLLIIWLFYRLKVHWEKQGADKIIKTVSVE